MMGGQIITEIRKAGMTPGQFVELSNGRTHYLLEGPEDGPLIVFFHGFGVFSYVYVVGLPTAGGSCPYHPVCCRYHQLFAPLTARGYRVLAFDFYGFGWSSAADGATCVLLPPLRHPSKLWCDSCGRVGVFSVPGTTRICL